MNIINLSVPAGVASPVADCGPVMIGYVGEHGVTQVMLDFGAWAEAYGEGIVTLGVQRSGDPTWYPVALETDGSSAVWTVSDVDTQVTGMGKARFAYTVAGAEKRSAVWAFYVAAGLVSPEGDPPDPYKSWVERMEQVGAETLQNAQDAQEAATEAEEDKEAAETAAEGASASKEDAEAWAVGERDGVPVPETDPTYQNNAKYWAEQAQTDSPVTSVNGQTGAVTLDAEDVGALPNSTTLDDIPDGATYKRPTAAQVQQIGTNAADIQTQGGEIDQLQTDVDTIEGKIPNQASPQNQLADKAFVNSSINSAAAYFRGAFATRAALFAVAWQTADPEAANYVSNNDYAYVADDETHNNEAWRYIYVLQPGGTDNGWQPQFKVNESPLTAAQLAALNSGATAALIEQISINAAALALKQAIINVGGILKGSGNGQVSAAVAGTDYATPAQVDAKYTKPAGGIPASDLAAGVIPSPYTSNPAALGTAAPGSSGSWARGDHVHPKPSAADIGAASRAIYQDARVVIGSGGTVGDSAVNSIILLSGDPAEAEFVEILAPNSLMIGAYKAGSRPAQIQIGARATPSANALGRNPWLADYTDSDGVFRSETDGLDVIAIGSAKAITRTNSPAIAFGTMVVARGGTSIAIGQQSIASGSFSVAVGVGLLSTQQDQVVLGRWNKDEQGDVFQIGNGTASGTTATRTNAFRVTKAGHVIAQNALGIEDGQGGVVEITAAQLQALKSLIS